jgi:diaminopimelate decarboxylase
VFGAARARGCKSAVVPEPLGIRRSEADGRQFIAVHRESRIERDRRIGDVDGTQSTLERCSRSNTPASEAAAVNIYISGVHSGPNPSAGVGVARSLRLAYPDATLIGVDYSNRSSGIHSPDFDEVWLQRPWNELDPEQYRLQIQDTLDAGALWISTLDLEIHWLAQALPRHPNLLIPPTAALKNIVKPAISAHARLPVGIPPFVLTTLPDWDLHAFCRRHGWRVWLKGPYHDAQRVWRWDVFRASRSELARLWSTDELFLQTHITGYEESITFCAYDGKLLDAAYMSKRDLTPEGKTWAGRVSDVPEDLARPLHEVVADLKWTGGAELEMIRDADGARWLMDWNPRFPAWIHGTTLAGRNLPGLLVAQASGATPREAPPISQEFTRVVMEVPVRSDYPLSPLPEPASGAFAHAAKHPSGMTKLAEWMHQTRGGEQPSPARKSRTRNGGKPSPAAPSVPSLVLADLAQHDVSDVDTPCSLFLRNTTVAAFERAANLAADLSSPGCRVLVAYSIKTNPDDRLLELWREHGLLAEAISQLELHKALAKGFAPDRVVLNGPGKWWPDAGETPGPLRAIFCDSVEDLRRVVKSGPPPQVIGMRLRPPGVYSRFGISLSDYDVFKEVASLAAALPTECALGVHFHMASSAVGVEQWWQLFDATLRQCRAIEAASQRSVECLDIGGGWFPDDFNDSFPARIRAGIATARRMLPQLNQFILEPGKALLQPAMALAVRVLEVRWSTQSPHQIEQVVVDGSIAELSQAHAYPHRILGRERRSDRWQALGRGHARILGRICMEDDILATEVDVPPDIRPGEVLIICDTGAYDRSMTYGFGRG